MKDIIHIIRPTVGVDTLEQLHDICLRQAAGKGEYASDGLAYFYTRNIPRRRKEILNGGSLYRIIKNRVQCRQKIMDIQEIRNQDGKPYAVVLLDPLPILTEPIPRKAFQGWRYLKPEDTPKDIGNYVPGPDSDLPEKMAGDLSALGLI